MDSVSPVGAEGENVTGSDGNLFLTWKPSTTTISGNHHIQLHNPIDQQKLVSGTRFY